MGENRLVVHSWKAVVKNTLCGFCTVELPNGLYIEDISIHQKNGRYWASLPSVPQLENGQQRFKDGKAQYKNILHWRDRDLADRFGEALISAIRAQHPGALS